MYQIVFYLSHMLSLEELEVKVTKTTLHHRDNLKPQRSVQLALLEGPFVST